MTAASAWDGPAECKRVRDAHGGSFEDVFHRAGIPAFALSGDGLTALEEPRLERAIGVIYRPEAERASHYFECDIRRQFDAVVHLDEACAVQPLDPDPGWERSGEAPETYPTGV